MQDIVVFAERRSSGSAVQRVPIAVTAVDQATMAAAHTVDLRDIGQMVPNAQLGSSGTYPGYANFFIRGIGVTSTVRSIDPAINVIQDGMVLAYQAGAVLDTFDLEGIEVLRGPQGVLFGRNASGGAVVLRSRRPTDEFKGRAEVVVGNADTLDTRLSVEGGIVPGVVAGRISFSMRRNNGLFDNVVGGTFRVVPTNPNTVSTPIVHPTGGVPRTREYIVKPTLAFTVSPDTTFTLFTQYQNYDDGGGATRNYQPANGTPGTLVTNWGYTPPTGKYQTNQSIQGYTKIEAYHAIGELQQSLGEGHSITATAAYRHVTYDSTLNVNGDPYSVTIHPDGRESNKQSSLEARYNGTFGDWEVLIGGFYLDTTSNVEEYRIVRSATSTSRTYFVNLWDQKVRSYALFGNIDWHIMDGLTLSSGLRYTKDRKRMHIIPLTACTGQNFTGCPTTYSNSEKSWDDFSPRLVLNYQPTSDLTFYASFAKGYRAGNYNARATNPAAAVTPADPETIKSYEIGAKTQFFDRRLRFNVTAFSADYADIQRIVQGTAAGQITQSLFNAASATIKGFEVETSVIPFTGFRLDGSVGYTNAQYKTFVGLTGLPAGVRIQDLQFDRAPKWTFHGAGSYSFDLAGGTMSARVSYTYRTREFMDVLNTPELLQKAYGLVDASLNYKYGSWDVSLFSRNLQNTDFAENRQRGTGFQAYGGSPRTYGIQAGISF